ncbi:MAG: molybdopterin-dependent oxidoreductase [Alphaproteobacteria bacterium]|nr:molybdopterin-dependent oxidoreductase [Alphaproteobacteria bacterium]
MPGAAYTEKSATYVNTEGRVQRAQRAVFPPGEAKEDWKIIRALSEVLGCTLDYDDAHQIQARMIENNPVFNQLDTVQPSAWKTIVSKGALTQNPFSSARSNFYMTDPISRHSATMARCHQELRSKEVSYAN